VAVPEDIGKDPKSVMDPTTLDLFVFVYLHYIFSDFIFTVYVGHTREGIVTVADTDLFGTH
jgi:hypothetical protein